MVNHALAFPRRLAGFTYLAVLLAVAMIGAGLGAVGQVWGTVQQREREKELLFIGNEFRQAIKHFVERGPGGAQAYPRQLSDLVMDKRYPTVQRYLRKIYRDPMTGGTEWGLIRGPDGGIAGVFSRSEAKPLKAVGFAARDARLENAKTYRDWVFLYEGGAQPAIPAPRGTPGAPGAPAAPSGFPPVPPGGAPASPGAPATQPPPFLPPEGRSP